MLPTTSSTPPLHQEVPPPTWVVLRGRRCTAEESRGAGVLKSFSHVQLRKAGGAGALKSSSHLRTAEESRGAGVLKSFSHIQLRKAGGQGCSNLSAVSGSCNQVRVWAVQCPHPWNLEFEQSADPPACSCSWARSCESWHARDAQASFWLLLAAWAM
eukprot:354819-Chlamydomonas_euryale.AAC.1